MSREIKFRAWLPESDQMIYINEYDGDEYHFYICKDGIKCDYFDRDHVKEGGGEIIDDPRWCKVDANIMQLTGLKDKNGVDIYEGDIVLLHNKSKYTKEEYWFPVYKIEYYKTGFKCQYVGGGLPVDNIEFNFIHYPNNLEVIGNIYENPELLKP